MKFKPELVTQKLAILVTTPEELDQLSVWANALPGRRPRVQKLPLPVQIVVNPIINNDIWGYMCHPSDFYSERGYTLISFNQSTLSNIRRP